MRAAAALRSLGLLGTLGAVACHFTTRFPDGSQRDDLALQNAAATFYRALAVSDTAALDSVTFGAATVVLSAGHSPPALIGWRALMDVPERRTRPPGIRVVRTDDHLDGDFATIRVVVSYQERQDASEFEASDLLTLARRTGAWRVSHALFGPWRMRTAP